MWVYRIVQSTPPGWLHTLSVTLIALTAVVHFFGKDAFRAVRDLVEKLLEERE
jgi:hypothetical protein